MYKMVVTDMDGTLLNSRMEITEKTAAAVKALKGLGVRFVMATGRLDIMMKAYIDQLENDGPVIGCNGAMVRIPKTGELLHGLCLKKEECEQVFALCRKHGLSYYLFCKDKLLGDDPQNPRIQFMREYNQRLLEKHRMQIEVTTDLARDMEKEEIYKIVIYHEDTSLLEQAAGEIKERVGVHAVRSGAKILDVVARGAGKEESMLRIAAKYGIAREEIIAFGDGQNDLLMLKAAGLSVAMGNAEESVKKAADCIALSNDEDGVAGKLAEIFHLDGREDEN